MIKGRIMKNFAIGFLACTCLFLMTASTKDINDILETPDELIKKIFNEGRSSQFQVTATKNQLYMINNKKFLPFYIKKI